MDPTRRRPGLRKHGGFALPIVILVTLILTITVGAGLILSATEHASGADHDASLQAYTVAQTGVERYLTDVTTLPTTFPDVRTIAVPGGTATVTLHRMRTATSTVSAIYVVSSVGRATANSLRRSSLTPVAERSITQFATWQAGTMTANAAYTSLGAVNIKNGASGAVNGFNESSCASASPAVPGLALPNGTFSGKNNFISGSTGNTPAPIGTPGPTGTAKDSVDVDWAGILAGSIAPDYALNPTNAHKSIFGSNIYANWPVVKLNGSMPNGWKTPNGGGGRGVLIVTGDADLSNVVWRGIVLVGGTATFSGGSVNVFGAMISGLNVKLGQTVGESTMNGNMSVQYNTCDIANALLKFGGWRRYANTWSDNWPSYTVP